VKNSTTSTNTNTYIDSSSKRLLRKFEALAPFKPKDRKAGKGDHEGWYTLALRESRLLKATYPDDRPELQKTYTSCLSQVTRLKKALKLGASESLLDEANKFPVLTICSHFGEALSSQFAQYKIQQSAVYREKVETRSLPENRIELDLSPFLKHAYEVLSEPDKFGWLEVSLAFALATGRRMAETHLSGDFTAIEGETHKLTFTGQLKGKGRKMGKLPLHRHRFTIPTLLPAALVLAGLDYLADEGKRLEFNPNWSYETITSVAPKVNSRYSKDLNKLTKSESWAILPDGTMTYHKFRGAYLRASLVNSRVDPFDYLDYACSVLGDRDESTIRSYQRFGLKADSLTRI